MPFITREDGEHFVVPSYRDVITAKNNSQLKKEIESLSQSYGEYITLQKKNSSQYEVAFSPDIGYLLGESIWHHFNRPQDLIYCEAIPNTSEAILVIVKSGSVYLDGSFPLDSIAEELVVFLTQQNDFEIYTYGDVPIAKEPEDGKFAFEESSVKSFTALQEPVFPSLPLLKIYKLELVVTVFEAHGIGVFPTRQVVTAVLVVAIGYFGYQLLTSEKAQEVQVQVMQITQEDPNEYYFEVLASPEPDKQIKAFLGMYELFSSIPGWSPQQVSYSGSKAEAKVSTKGALVEGLLDWAKIKNVTVDIEKEGINLSKDFDMASRSRPFGTRPLNGTVATLIDRVHTIYPGNVMQIGQIVKKGNIKSLSMKMELTNVTPMQLSLIGEQLQRLPIKILGITMEMGDNSVNVSIDMQVVGT